MSSVQAHLYHLLIGITSIYSLRCYQVLVCVSVCVYLWGRIMLDYQIVCVRKKLIRNQDKCMNKYLYTLWKCVCEWMGLCKLPCMFISLCATVIESAGSAATDVLLHGEVDCWKWLCVCAHFSSCVERITSGSQELLYSSTIREETLIKEVSLFAWLPATKAKTTLILPICFHDFWLSTGSVHPQIYLHVIY